MSDQTFIPSLKENMFKLLEYKYKTTEAGGLWQTDGGQVMLLNRTQL